MQVTTIGLDLAKSVFQVHGVDEAGRVVVAKALRRGQVPGFFAKVPPCLIGMEACATAHHWARELAKLGHRVRLIPPAYVKPYVRRGKNDAADAAAICEAVTRPSMRFVPVKSVENQAALMAHRSRDLLIRQRTQLVNALRAHLAELGLIAAQGRDGLSKLIAIVEGEERRAEDREHLEGDLGLQFRVVEAFAEPGALKRLPAERIAAGPAEAVPIGDGEAQMVLHALAHDEPVGFVKTEGHRVGGVRAFELDRLDAFEKVAHVSASFSAG